MNRGRRLGTAGAAIILVLLSGCRSAERAAPSRAPIVRASAQEAAQAPAGFDRFTGPERVFAEVRSVVRTGRTVTFDLGENGTDVKALRVERRSRNQTEGYDILFRSNTINNAGNGNNESPTFTAEDTGTGLILEVEESTVYVTGDDPNVTTPRILVIGDGTIIMVQSFAVRDRVYLLAGTSVRIEAVDAPGVPLAVLTDINYYIEVVRDALGNLEVGPPTPIGSDPDILDFVRESIEMAELAELPTPSIMPMAD